MHSRIDKRNQNGLLRVSVTSCQNLFAVQNVTTIEARNFFAFFIMAQILTPNRRLKEPILMPVVDSVELPFTEKEITGRPNRTRLQRALPGVARPSMYNLVSRDLVTQAGLRNDRGFCMVR